ncbi:ABC transporter permease subunit [Bacillus pacificus]
MLFCKKRQKKILNEEFIEAATILGGSKFHLAIKHIFPNIFPILIIVMMQQFVQTLIIFSHFGILELFFWWYNSFLRK